MNQIYTSASRLDRVFILVVLYRVFILVFLDRVLALELDIFFLMATETPDVVVLSASGGNPTDFLGDEDGLGLDTLLLGTFTLSIRWKNCENLFVRMDWIILSNTSTLNLDLWPARLQ
jgi:hypothetical protein